MYSIKHLLHINASKESIYKAIATIYGTSNWWTVEVGGGDALGEVIQFTFGGSGCTGMQLKELIPNEKVTWLCVESPYGWEGNTIEFVLDENEGKTRLRFSHSGWTEPNDFYASCSFSWARYLESLRQYCQTGHGEAFGSIGYRK